MSEVNPAYLKPIKEKAMLYINMFRDGAGVSLEKSKACAQIMVREMKKSYETNFPADRTSPEDEKRFNSHMAAFDLLIKGIQGY